jgi:GLPGLI family protein
MLLLGCLSISVAGRAQKIVSELTLVYEYSVNPTDDGKQGGTTENAVHTVYIKGNKSRSEISNSMFSSTVIFDSNAGSGVILKEVSGQKLLIRMNADNWAERNRMYDGIVYKNTTETKEIAGYKCIKAIGQAPSGTTITVYYTRDVIPENRQYEPSFRTLDGLPLEYELANGNVRIRYRIARINLNPVPASKFDVPNSGYRELSYEDSKKMNIGG